MFINKYFRQVIVVLFFAVLSISNAQTIDTKKENASHQQHMHNKGYIDDANNEIKALPEADIVSLLDGAGMGFAKAAELNSYPGPKHVLIFLNELKLTDEQARKTEALIQPMKMKAIELGKQIIQKEKELDLLFKNKVANEDTINKKIMEIAQLQGKLRYVHLSTHLKQKEILTTNQINMYNQLRGYN